MFCDSRQLASGHRTTGLHFEDVKNLLGVLHPCRTRADTMISIEHNLDAMKTAGRVSDLGPNAPPTVGVSPERSMRPM